MFGSFISHPMHPVGKTAIFMNYDYNLCIILLFWKTTEVEKGCPFSVVTSIHW